MTSIIVSFLSVIIIFILGVIIGAVSKGIEINIHTDPKPKPPKLKNTPQPGVTHLTPERESNFAKLNQEREEPF